MQACPCSSSSSAIADRGSVLLDAVQQFQGGGRAVWAAAPDSKLGCLEWLDTVETPGVSEKPSHDHLLRCMDALAEHSDADEDRVAELLRPMLDQQLSVVFYDFTIVRIYGEGEVQNDLRRYGMSTRCCCSG